MKGFVVWQLACVEYDYYYTVNGVIINHYIGLFASDKAWYKNAIYVAGTYIKKPLSNANISLQISNERFDLQTSKNGSFSLKVPKSINFDDISITYENNKLPIIQNYPLVFNDVTSDYVVISDIDETIIKSYTSNAYKRIKTTLFSNVDRRKVIDFTLGLYRKLEQKGSRFFYVSRSERNLFQIISGFIVQNKLPQGMLYLTEYLGFSDLIKNKKEKEFKFNKINTIIKQQTNKSLILVGDDSQHDPEIYSRIASKYKSQIKAVYIRETKRKTQSHAAIENWKNNHSGIPLVVFKYDQLFNESFVPF